jgi:hypothetical protein
MRKLSLKVDELEIESFDTLEESRSKKGTVQGHVSLASCSCVMCGTETVCNSEDWTACVDICTKDADTQFNWQNTCINTCAGVTCEFASCACTNGC